MPYMLFNGIGGLMNYMNNQNINKHEFKPANDKSITIREALSFSDNVMKNMVWLRGDTWELQQLYQNLARDGKRKNFWGETTGQSHDVKRITSGLAAKMVEIMAYVVLNDLRDLDFQNDADTEIWLEIARENRFNNLLDDALKKVLALGDGAFKVTYESALTDKPIIEFYPANMVEYVRHRGRIQEIVFSTNYEHNGNIYTLKERYGYGYIINNLYKGNIECALSTIPQTAGIADFYFAGGEGKNGEVKNKGEYMLAVPFIIYTSAKYEGRGKSIYDERESLFAAHDEDFSLWVESLEAGAPKTGIRRDNLRHDPQTGKEIVPNGLTRYFVLEGGRNGDGNSNGLGIEQIQFDIPWQTYYETHKAFLESILTGFMSPATLGYFLSAVNSGESVREKEKMTLYTRAYIVEVMSEIIKELAMISVQSFYDYHGINSICSEPDVDFGDYASPTFNDVVTTVVAAKQGGAMSTDTAVRELAGDSKSEEWILAEIARIKEEQSYGMMDSLPDFGGDVDYPEDEEDIDVPEDDEEEE
jgi:hypothetical protein